MYRIAFKSTKITKMGKYEVDMKTDIKIMALINKLKKLNLECKERIRECQAYIKGDKTPDIQ
jgi:hypothetical protein